MKKNNPRLFEINTRVFLKRFGSNTRLIDVPQNYWLELRNFGVDFIWLMGIWKTCNTVIEKYCLDDELKQSYSRALKDWKKEDVIGSPFSIDKYVINQAIGTLSELLELKNFLNNNGMGLILDFIPNHFSADTELLNTNPEIFLEVNKSTFEKDPYTYFKPFKNKERYFAHGRDPFFPAWADTIQVNYMSKSARDFMKNIIFELTDICDGIRCDMAMLVLNNVFNNTWVIGNSIFEQSLISVEFWDDAINDVKKNHPEFLFIAEAYWDLEWKLQNLGFDFTYDKKLTDRLLNGSVHDIKEHLSFEKTYQDKSVRFIENHDEERAALSFGKEKSKAAAVIISTIQGMRLYYDGQFIGKKIKLPLQLGREPDEYDLNGVKIFYDKLISVVSADVFSLGEWKMLNPESSWFGNISYQNMLAWQWRYKNDFYIVIINYSDVVSSCRLKIDLSGYPEEIELYDLLNAQKYIRSAEEIYHTGLYVELKPWQSHIFKI